MKDRFEDYFNSFCREVHDDCVKAGWWTNLEDGSPKDRNLGELLLLCVTEIAEAYEGERKGMMDKHLPQYRAFDVELADLIIRVADIAGSRKIPLGKIIQEKRDYNAVRPDHKIENRMAVGGKKF